MKKRTAFVGAILSLMSFGHPSLIKTGVVISTSGLMLFHSAKVNAESAIFYYEIAMDKYAKGDYQDAISDFTKAIEINPKVANVYYYRGIVKETKGDKKGFCSDVKKALSLGFKEEDKQLIAKNCD